MAQKPRDLTPERSPQHQLGAELRRWRELRGLSQASLAKMLHVSSALIAKIEVADRRMPRGMSAELDRHLATGGGIHRLEQTFAGVIPTRDDALDALRQRVEEGLNGAGITQFSLDDWEQVILAHGRATRHRVPSLLVEDISADVDDLVRLLTASNHSASNQLRLTSIIGKAAGLVSLSLLKVNNRRGSVRWVRTAWSAAREAGDNGLAAWVRAQEAHNAFYSGDLPDAVEKARHAQELAGGTMCVGFVLAAALEGRALASQGRHDETHIALATAENGFAELSTSDLTRSALGYDEAQLRFHQGNAYTHLGLTDLAWQAQKRALDLYPENDYLDRALVHLDRAQCLVHQREPDAAMAVAEAGITGLRHDQRQGLVTVRALEVLSTMPTEWRTRPAARSVQDLLSE